MNIYIHIYEVTHTLIVYKRKIIALSIRKTQSILVLIIWMNRKYGCKIELIVSSKRQYTQVIQNNCTSNKRTI